MNKYEKRSIEAYNKKAKNYEDTFDGKFTSKFKTMLIETAKINTGDNIIDIACGNGRLLNMFKSRYEIKGFGTDISNEMVNQAKLMNPSMNFSVASCEEIPFPDNSFDIITVCAAYHHFPDVAKFAREACRVLKQGGTIYIAEVYCHPVIRIFCNPFLPLLKEGDVKFYSPYEIINTLSSAGFISQTHIKRNHIQIVSACK